MTAPTAAAASPASPAAPLPAHLRPMGIGDIIDTALRLYRAHFRRLFTTALAFNTVIYAVQSVFQSWYFDRLRVLQNPDQVRALAANPADLGVFLGGFLGGLAGFTLFYLLGYQLVVAALTWGTGRVYLGEAFDVGGAYRAVLRRFPAIVGTYLLQMIVVVVASSLAAVPGLALVLLGRFAAVLGVLLGLATAVVVGLVLALRYLLTTEVVVLEGVAGLTALRRSAKLMAGSVSPGLPGNQKIRASVLLTVMLMVNGTLAFVASMPRLAVQLAFGASPWDPSFDPSSAPLVLLLPTYVIELLGQTAIMPFGLITLVLFYYDTRIRREGFDLELLAQRMGAPGA